VCLLSLGVQLPGSSPPVGVASRPPESRSACLTGALLLRSLQGAMDLDVLLRAPRMFVLWKGAPPPARLFPPRLRRSSGPPRGPLCVLAAAAFQGQCGPPVSRSPWAETEEPGWESVRASSFCRRDRNLFTCFLQHFFALFLFSFHRISLFP